MKEVADQIDKDRGFTAKIQEIISSISTKNDEQKVSFLFFFFFYLFFF